MPKCTRDCSLELVREVLMIHGGLGGTHFPDARCLLFENKVTEKAKLFGHEVKIRAWQIWLCVPKGLKIDENRGLNGPKIVQNRGLGSSLGGLGCLWRNFGQGFSENRRQDEPKMS